MTYHKTVSFFILSSLLSLTAISATINVTTSQSINTVIASAQPGDTLQLAAGTYSQSAIVVNKSLIIQGAGIDNAVINSSPQFTFRITANDVAIKDLNIRNANPGISVNLSGQTINNLKITNARIGNGVTIPNILAAAVQIEAATMVTGMEVDGCDFRNNTGAGIHSPVGSFGDGIDVSNTTFFDNDAGIFQRHSGTAGFIKNLHVKDNCTFQNNDFEGIFAHEISDSIIENSSFSGNKRDFYINKFADGTSNVINNVVIRGNTFTNAIAQSIWLRILSVPVPFGSQGITIESNVFNQNVDTRALGNNSMVLDTQGIFEAIIEAIFENDNDDQHGPLNINKNTFNLTGNLSGGTSAETAFAIALNSGIRNVDIKGNIMNGNDVNALGTAAVKVSGIFFVTNDDDLGVIPDTANVCVAGNKITGFEAGASLFDFSRQSFGFLDDDATITFSNNFLENDKGIVSGATGATINASGNWWGSNDENAINAMMSGKIDFSPYLNSGADTDGDPNNGFQGDFSSLTATFLGQQIGNSASNSR